MANGVNLVILIGNLGNDPELKHTPNGSAVCEFRLATNEAWNDKEGQRQERTEWHRIVVWGKKAEVCSKYLAKGRQVYLEGRLQTRQWEDKEGNKRYTTEIVARDVQFLGGGKNSDRDEDRDGGRGRGRDRDESAPSGDYFGGGGAPDDDIPF